MDLRTVDLNLLTVLEALLDERNVTRAASRLNMSQPAASRALARLRATFADTLLVDCPGGYVLSARAEALRPLLRQALSGIGQLLAAPAFDPATATGTVRLVMPDLQAAVLMPALIAEFSSGAPCLDLTVNAPGPDPLKLLEEGAADALIGLVEEAPAGIARRRLYDERLVTFMRADHPRATKPLSLEDFLTCYHVAVTITGVGPAPVDEVLARMGLERRVRARAPNFFAALEIVARTDLVATLPESLMRMTAPSHRVVTINTPLDLAPFPMSLVWHARRQDDPRHVWLRGRIVAAAKTLTA